MPQIWLFAAGVSGISIHKWSLTVEWDRCMALGHYNCTYYAAFLHGVEFGHTHCYTHLYWKSTAHTTSPVQKQTEDLFHTTIPPNPTFPLYKHRGVFTSWKQTTHTHCQCVSRFRKQMSETINIWRSGCEMNDQVNNLAKGCVCLQAGDLSGPVLTVERGNGASHAQVMVPAEGLWRRICIDRALCSMYTVFWRWTENRDFHVPHDEAWKHGEDGRRRTAGLLLNGVDRGPLF